MVEAHGKRVEPFQWIAAWHLCHILNMFVKKGHSAITPAQLMGKSREAVPDDFKMIKRKALMKRIGMSHPDDDAE